MTMPSYNYRAFGLNISSAIPLSGLLPTTGPADVIISVGNLPPEMSGTEEDRYVAPGECVRRSRLFGGYAIYQGREIILTPQMVTFLEESEQAVYLVETIFVFLWLQRGALCFHASSVNINGRAVVFVGVGGSGKSTTSAALACRGYDKLADDVCLIIVGHDSVPHVVPLCGCQSLTSDSLDMLGLTSSGAYQFPGMVKYVFPYRSSLSEPLPLGGVYHLYPEDTDEIEFIPVTGFDKLAILAANCKNGKDAEQMFPRSGSLIERLVQLGNRMSVTRIIRPRRRDRLSELATRIEVENIERR